MKAQDVRAILAERLREFRISAGLSTVDVGSAIGKSGKTVSGWEHGRGQPDADMLFTLCDLYKIKDISAFFPSSHDGCVELHEDEEELLRSYRMLNSEGKNAIMTTLRAFVGNPTMLKERHTQSAI